MSASKKFLNVSVRLIICGLLLLWIFHSIFLNEGRFDYESHGKDWTALTRSQQWEVAWTIGPHELWGMLRTVNIGAFGLSLVMVGLTIIIGVIRWRMILESQGLHLSLVRATEINFVAQFFNSFLLGATGGDLMKAFYAARETHHKKTEAVVTVFVDRLLGLWSMLAFAVLMMLPNYALFFADGTLTKEQLTAMAALRTAAVIVIGMLVACSVILYLALWGGLSNRWPNARAFLRKLPKAQHLERSLDSCRVFGRQKALLMKTVVLSMVLNAICVVQVIILAYGLHFGDKISSLALFTIVPTITCISALPITPSGLGVREGLFVGILAIRVGKTAALSLSLLTFAGSLFWSIVGGVVYFCLKEKQHLTEITDQPEAVSEEAV